MLCAKSIVDLCKSRAALKQGSSFSNIVLANWPGRVIYVHTKKERQVCAMITEIDFKVTGEERKKLAYTHLGLEDAEDD